MEEQPDEDVEIPDGLEEGQEDEGEHYEDDDENMLEIDEN